MGMGMVIEKKCEEGGKGGMGKGRKKRRYKTLVG